MDGRSICMFVVWCSESDIILIGFIRFANPNNIQPNELCTSIFATDLMSVKESGVPGLLHSSRRNSTLHFNGARLSN